MILEQSTSDLDAIVRWMVQAKKIKPWISSIRLKHSSRQDLVNETDPRVFCSVEPNKVFIFCSEALEWVAPRVRVGILMHEIGHIYIDAFRGDECEVDVDAWVLENFPEAEYGYANHRYYNQELDQDVIAVNVEHVSPQFLERLDDYRRP